MPPGRHRISASQAGKPLTVEVTVDAQTASTLQVFLAAKLAAAADGREDRPFFDFNHEDREAAAWPMEFFWAGDDPKTGGVRARIEWTDSGRRAVEGRTFRRFSPTFHIDAAGRVTGSEINMGGLVNRAAFKRIAPLFASATPVMEPETQNAKPETCSLDSELRTQNSEPGSGHTAIVAPVDTSSAASMHTLLATLRSLKLIDAAATEEPDLVSQVTTAVGALQSEIRSLQLAITAAAKQRAESLIDAAVRAGRLAAKDADARSFWIEALLRDESKAVKALDALPFNPVLARVVPPDADSTRPESLLTRQEQKLAAVRAAHPTADFSTIYAKAKAESPQMFR